ncbi:hypothetical protein [Actinokineospora iranica]|uniref:Uncharacterized protein n=1 Tax=Actinokineospora iranica TaxID=1271860 RepID=A0A1G6K333_9PSEU|nr:hypothetical protein [Actinokineospora iranica]SDC25298.1 hypothetical protein SAMN05216174_101686 [Actinokineospora iranica]
MTTPPVIICRTCDTALDRHTDDQGASYQHTLAAGPVDHDPVPVQAPPDWRGKCDFCLDTAEFVVPARDFTVPGLDRYMSLGNWAACSACALLIGANRWTNLINRAAATHHRRHGTEINEATRTHLGRLYRRLRANITGPIRPIGEQP